MKKIILFVACIMIVLPLTGCRQKISIPDDPMVFEEKSCDDYMALTYEDKEYVPFCAYESKYLGECIGYYVCDDGEKGYIFSFKGESPDEWIIDITSIDSCTEGMICREKNVTEMIDGLESPSEYTWNNDVQCN